MPVNRPMRSSTERFCTTSSRVGQTQSACGAWSPGSTRLSMASVKHTVFPLPLCAWAIKLRWGGVRIMGSVWACKQKEGGGEGGIIAGNCSVREGSQWKGVYTCMFV
jgi:hypothetical protein